MMNIVINFIAVTWIDFRFYWKLKYNMVLLQVFIPCMMMSHWNSLPCFSGGTVHLTIFFINLFIFTKASSTVD